MESISNQMISEVLYRLNVNSPIELDLLSKAFGKILSSKSIKSRDVHLGAFLTGLMAKGPTVDEVVCLLDESFKLDNYDPSSSMRIEIPKGEKLVGAIGSGKKGIKTINISTPALLVAASAGVYTAKSVSCATSSVTGSADLVRELGINTDIPNEDMINTIRDTGFGVFCIEDMIPKFNAIYSGKFYVPHTLSFGLGALVSPIKYDNFLYGIAHPNIDLTVKVLDNYDVKDVMVASTTHDGIHYLDEMGVYGTTRLVGIRDGVIGKIVDFDPLAKLGLEKYDPSCIAQGQTTDENVKYVVDILCGNGDKAREDIVCINAGTLLYLADKAENLREGFIIAKNHVKRKKPIEKLVEVIEHTGGCMGSLDGYLR